MNPLERVESMIRDLASSQLRSELYLSGLFSVQLYGLGIVSLEELAEIINTIHRSIEQSLTTQEERRKAEKLWPVKNLAA